MMKLTQAQIEALRQAVEHARAEDLVKFTKIEGPEATELAEDVRAYFHRFARPAEGHPCLACGEKLNPSMVESLMGKGGFEWGLVHGHGHCRNCGWPATAYHFIKDRHGKEIAVLRGVVLQAHPDDVDVRSEHQAALGPEPPR